MYHGLRFICLFASRWRKDRGIYKIKQYYAGQFRSGFDGPFALSSKIQNLLYRGLPMDYYHSLLSDIWAISAEEIMEAANNYLDPKSFITVLSGNIH